MKLIRTYSITYPDSRISVYANGYGRCFDCPFCQAPVEVFVRDFDFQPEVDCPGCGLTLGVQVAVMVSYDEGD